MFLYETPKREVDHKLRKSQKKGLKLLYDKYFTEHGLCYESLLAVRDDYVHRVMAVGDLYKDVEQMPVSDVMSFVKHFSLDISHAQVRARKNDVLKYLRSVCDTFGYVTIEGGVNSNGRYVP